MLSIKNQIFIGLLCCFAATATAQIDDDPSLATAHFEPLSADTVMNQAEVGELVYGTGVTAAPANTKKALVIGIADYDYEGKLSAPVNDAKAMAGLLRKNGWQVQGHENLRTKKSFEVIVEHFRKVLTPQDEVLVYYSGHGFQWGSRNFFVPKTANINSRRDIEEQAYPLENIIKMLNNSKCRVKIVLLDACRSNLSGNVKQIAKVDLKIITADVVKPPPTALQENPELALGTLVAHATAPGKPALDGRQFSVFTGALLSVLIQAPCKSLTEALQDASGIVIRKTKKEQIPWENSSLTGKIILGRCN
jgi:uncharacterized caspase-like protein